MSIVGGYYKGRFYHLVKIHWKQAEENPDIAFWWTDIDDPEGHAPQVRNQEMYKFGEFENEDAMRTLLDYALRARIITECGDSGISDQIESDQFVVGLIDGQLMYLEIGHYNDMLRGQNKYWYRVDNRDCTEESVSLSDVQIFDNRFPSVEMIESIFKTR